MKVENKFMMHDFTRDYYEAIYGKANIKKIDGKSYLLDKDNKIISNGYNAIKPINSNYLTVADYSKRGIGCIDELGNEIIPCKYDNVSTEILSNGLTKVLKKVSPAEYSKYGYIPSSVYPSRKSMYLYGFVNENGIEEIPCKFEVAKDFKENFAVVAKYNESHIYLFTYIDRSGKELTDYKYYGAGDFSEGFGPVLDENGLWGFLDTNMELAIPHIYKEVHLFKDGLCAVKNDDNKWGFINKNGELFIPCQFNNVKDFSEGLCSVQGDNNLWGYIDTTGKLVIDYKYVASNNYTNGLACTSILKDDTFGYGYIDKTGKKAIKHNFNNINAKDFQGDVAAVKGRKGWGVINKEGKVIVNKKYDEVTFANNLIRAVINKNGEEKIHWYDNDGNLISRIEYCSIVNVNDIEYSLVANSEKELREMKIELFKDIRKSYYNSVVLPIKFDQEAFGCTEVFEEKLKEIDKALLYHQLGGEILKLLHKKTS